MWYFSPHLVSGSLFVMNGLKNTSTPRKASIVSTLRKRRDNYYGVLAKFNKLA